MAESSLSIGFTELKQEIGFFLGHGRGGTAFADWAAMTPDPSTEVELIVRAGIRRVYYPPGVNGYEWNFLRPTNTLNLGASGTDGVTSSSVLTSATFANWETQGITTDDTLTVSDSTSDAATIGDYAITTVSAGNITLTTDPGDATGITFILKRSPADYDLPDDFGRLVGGLHFAADENRVEVSVVSIGRLLEMRSMNDLSGAPVYAAIRYKSSDGSGGQRQEILFWPKPDIYYVLSYNYEAYSGELSDSNPYPLGGMQLAELYTESCLTVAEQRINNEVGLHNQLYQALLADAIARDRKRGARIFGHMGHVEEFSEFGRHRYFRHGYTGGTYRITYDGSVL